MALFSGIHFWMDDWGSARAARAVSSALAGNIEECVRRGVEPDSRGGCAPHSEFRRGNLSRRNQMKADQNSFPEFSLRRREESLMKASLVTSTPTETAVLVLVY